MLSASEVITDCSPLTILLETVVAGNIVDLIEFDTMGSLSAWTRYCL